MSAYVLTYHISLTAIAAQYFNVFVGIAQAFEKIPLLKSLAPTQSEPPRRLCSRNRQCSAGTSRIAPRTPT